MPFSIVPMVSCYKQGYMEGQKIYYLLDVLNQWFLNFKIHSLYSFNEMLFIVTLKQKLKH